MIISRDGNAEASTSRTPLQVPLLYGQPDRISRPSAEDSVTRNQPRVFGPKPQQYLDLPRMDKESPQSSSWISPAHRSFFRPTNHDATQTPSPEKPGSRLPPSHTAYPIFSPSESASQLHIYVPPQYRSMVSGACAGFVASIVTCPLDVLKTALQASSSAHTSKEYEGVRRTAWRIWSQSGLIGFYRGLGPTLAGYLPTWGIYFTVYDLVKDRLKEVGQDRPGFDTSFQHILAAMTAGATGTIFTNPIWVVKTRFMAQATLHPNALRYRNTLEAFATIYRTEGFQTFYKGLLPSLMGVIHVAVQFPLYEKFKTLADTHQAGSDNHSSLPASTILACSAASKMIASVATYPHEVLRTRLQINKSHGTPETTKSPRAPLPTAAAQSSATLPNSSAGPSSASAASSLRPHHHQTLYSPLVTGSNPPVPLSLPLQPNSPLRLAAPGARPTAVVPGTSNGPKQWGRKGGIVDTFMQIKRQDGWKGFYRGLSINLVRTVPNSAVTMLTYELIMRRLA